MNSDRNRLPLTPFRLLAQTTTWLWTLVVALPLFYLACLSLARGTAASDRRWYILPSSPTLSNYRQAFGFMRDAVTPLPQVFINSGIATGLAVAGGLALATLAAFPLATMRFPGRRLVFALIALGLVVPTSVMIVPEFLTVTSYGLSGRPALILPYVAFGISLPTVIMTVFFQSIPTSVYEAARIDGAGTFRVFWSIALPLSRPALATGALFLFVIFWNEFPLALTLINNPSQSTIPLAIASTQSKNGTPYQVIAAIMVLASIPVAAIFALGNRQLVNALALSTDKG